MDLDQTQALDLGEYDDEIGSGSEENQNEAGLSKKLVAHLKVFSHKDFCEKVFPLYEGENDIGRGESCCVFIPLKALSKKHAVIDVKGGLHLIHDCESKNKTRKEKVFLKPKIRYELKHGDMLTLADVRCQYLIDPLTEKSAAEDKSETGSETGSESMLPSSQDDEADFGKITAASEEAWPKEEKGDFPTNGKVPPAHPVVRHKEEGLSTEKVYAAETDDETDDDDDDDDNDDVPFNTPGQPTIKGSDDEEEEKPTYNNGQGGSAANLPVVSKLPAEGAVDSEKTGEESEIPRMKLLYESESDDDDTPIAGQPLPQTPGFDDSTDDEQETATVKKTPLVKQQISGEGETLAFGLGTPEDVIRPRESQKTQSIEATLAVSPDSPERSSSPTVLPFGRENAPGTMCAETLLYGSDDDGLADHDDKTKNTSVTCPATLIYRSDEEEEDPNGDESPKQPITGREQQLRDEELGETLDAGGTAKVVDVYGPTLAYTSGEETSASPAAMGGETPVDEKAKSPLSPSEEGEEETEEGEADKGEDQGSEGGVEGVNTDPVDVDATQAYSFDSDNTDDEDLLIAATQAYEPATRKKQVAAEGNDDVATQAYDDGDEENRNDDDLLPAATQAYEPATRRKQVTSEGDDDMATQANEPATRRKQMIAEGDDNMATQVYDDGDEENRNDPAATQACQTAGTSNQATLAYGADDTETQAYDDENEDETNNMEATLAYGAGLATQPFAAPDNMSGEGKGTGASIMQEDLQQTLAYGVPDVEAPDSMSGERKGTGAGKMQENLQQTLAYGVPDVEETQAYGAGEAFEESSAFEVCEATQAYGLDNPTRHPVVPDSQDAPDTPTAQEKEAKKGRRVTFAEVNETDEGDVESSEEPAEIVHTTHDESMSTTREPVTLQERDDSEEDFVRPKRKARHKPPSFLDSQESESDEIEKEDVLLKDVASSSSLTAVAAVEEPKETTAATKRISRRGTKKPYVEIVQGSEPEKAQGRRTRGRGAKEQESRGQGGTSGRQSKAAEPVDDENLPGNEPEVSSVKSTRGRGRKSKAAEPVESGVLPDDIPETSGRGRQSKTAEPIEPEVSPDDVPETSTGKGKKGRGRQSKAGPPTEDEAPPDYTPETSTAKDEKSQGRQSKAAEPSESEVLPDDIPETPTAKGKKGHGKQSKTAKPTESEAPPSETVAEDVPAALAAKDKKGRGRQSKATEPTESETPPDDRPETSTAKDRKGRGRQSKAAELVEDDNVPETSSVKSTRSRGRKSKAAEPSEPETLPDDVPETSLATGRRGRGKQSKAAESTELGPEPANAPETSSARGTRGSGRKSKATEPTEHESLPEDVPETVTLKGNRAGGRQSKAAEPSEPSNASEVVSKASPVRGTRSRGRQSKAAEPENELEDVPETTTQRSGRSRGKQSKAAEPENVPEDVPEMTTQRSRRSWGKQSKAAEPENVPEDVPETTTQRSGRSWGKQSKAAEPENVPEDVPEVTTQRSRRSWGKQSKAAEPENVPEDVPETMTQRKGRSWGKQSKAAEPENVPEDVPETTTQRSRRSRGKRSKAAEPENVPEDVPETTTQRSRRSRGKQKASEEPLDEFPGSEELPQDEPETTAETGRAKKRQVKQSDVAAAEKNEPADESSTATPSSSPVKGRGKGRGKKAKLSQPSTSRAVLEQIPTDEDAEEEPAVMDIPSRRRGRGRGASTKDDSNIKDNEETEVEPSSEPGPSNRRGRRSRVRQRDKGVSEDSETPDSSQTLSPPDARSEGVGGSQESGTRKGRGRKRQVDQSPESQPQATPSKRGRKQGPPAVGGSPALRQRKPGDVKPRVMFTGLVDKRGEKIVANLGGELVDSVYSCTHLVTDKVRRTVKFLCGLASGQIIVLPSWLDACNKAKAFVDPRSFFVKDKDAEKQYKFSLERSHERAVEKGLLEGYKVHVTAHVKPEAQQMKDIIKCAKGEFVPRVPQQGAENLLVISCEDDRLACQPCVTAGIPVYTAELLLTGILRQELELHEHRLFSDDKGTDGASGAGTKRGHDTNQGSSTSATPRGSKRRKR